MRNDEKIELMGFHLFGDLWRPRYIPTEEDLAKYSNYPNTSATSQSEPNNPDQPNAT